MKGIKRIALILILVFVSLCCFAKVTERVITGIKKGGDVPSPFAVIKIIGPENETVLENSNITISEIMRNKSYDVFSWSLSGNYYTALNVKFIFSPLTCASDISQAEEGDIIPYSITLTHGSTTASGVTITTTVPESGEGIIGEFDNSVYYRLAEYVRYSADGVSAQADPITMNMSGTSNKWIKLSYDFSQNSKVENSMHSEVEYTLRVCNVWARTGAAKIVLKMDDTGYSVPFGNEDPVYLNDGVFTSTVTVEITSGS